MARFEIDRPLTTREPTVTVDAGLPLGRHLFRLVVIDVQGRRSPPTDAVVDVQRSIDGGPTPVRPSPLVPASPLIRPAQAIDPNRPSASPTPRRPRARRKKEMS